MRSELKEYKKEFGDYQTPLYFARRVLSYLDECYDLNPDVVVEPTCGVGNFIVASREVYPSSRVVGIDVNEDYLSRVSVVAEDVLLFNESVFSFDFDSILEEGCEYLVVGNPPWVTNTDLSKLESGNVPVKSNFKNLDLFDSVTGMSNFDISEYIILYVLDRFRDARCCVAFLCKYGVACKVFEFIVENEIAITGIEIIRFNARKVFGIDASSCILVIRLSATGSIVDRCSVKDIDDRRVVYDIGFIGGKFYSRLTDVPDIDGVCPFEWRQGIKHDCSSVMELKVVADDFENKLGSVVSLEDDLLYPLLKSSSLKNALIDSSDRRVIVTQHKLREDTSYIRTEFPRLWKYLDTNRELFNKRKSRIYDNCPSFSLFGIGDYAFKKYKVAVSGFYKKALFCLVYSDKAMMLDDTCYYLSFDDFDSAYVTMLLLNTPIVEVFLNSIVLVDSKRPYTKKVLKRIDLAKVMDLVCYDDLVEVENKLCLDNYITEEVLDVYCSNYF